jgi:hypothetical protein
MELGRVGKRVNRWLQPIFHRYKFSPRNLHQHYERQDHLAQKYATLVIDITQKSILTRLTLKDNDSRNQKKLIFQCKFFGC